MDQLLVLGEVEVEKSQVEAKKFLVQAEEQKVVEQSLQVHWIPVHLFFFGLATGGDRNGFFCFCS